MKVKDALSPAERPGALAAPLAGPSIGDILQQAVTQGMAPESLEKLVAVYERMADRAAAQEFALAMAAFQSECPSLPKTSKAKITTKSGITYEYTYAALDTIAEVVRPILQKHGLSYTWDSSEEQGKITCACVIRHINGHQVRASFTCPTDSAAAMSGAQKNAAALTYARRQSLVQALGLTTTDPDTDGAPASPITAHQAANLRALADEVKADMPRFLAYLKVKSLEELPSSKFEQALSALESKRRKA